MDFDRIDRRVALRIQNSPFQVELNAYPQFGILKCLMLRVRRSTADAGADNGGHNNGDLVYSMEDWTFLKLTTVPWAVILMVVNGLVVVTGCNLDP